MDGSATEKSGIMAQTPAVFCNNRRVSNGDQVNQIAKLAERAVRAARFVGFYGPTGRADRSAVGIGPADHAECGLSFRISHAEDLSEAQGLCRFAEEEVLGHVAT
jgi:hypothetical protein